MLTDLESTNGTRVNGENVQLWILRYGDLIAMGRSVLLFGSPARSPGIWPASAAWTCRPAWLWRGTSRKGCGGVLLAGVGDFLGREPSRRG